MDKNYTEADLPGLLTEVEGMSAFEVMVWSAQKFGSDLTFASSLGLEDQVLTDWAVSNKISIFTLDTGRLFPESYDLLAKTEQFFKQRIKIYYPQTEGVECLVEVHGINLFYNSISLRKKCCHVRKLEPLKRALSGKKAWVCGLRREQAQTRQDIKVIEWDHLHHIIKINPLVDWSEKRVTDYLSLKKIPYNPLHDRGFVSIGCACCTRAIKVGQHVREGRWWWESPEHKECGLHSSPVEKQKLVNEEK